MTGQYVRELSHPDYWKWLEKRVRKDRYPTLAPGTRAICLHEAGHAIGAIATGGRALHIRMGATPDGDPTTAHCQTAIKQCPGGDDAQWAEAVVHWSGPLACDSLAGSWFDLTKVRELGKQYLVDRSEYSAFAAARLLVDRHRAVVEAIADVFGEKGEVTTDELDRLTAGIGKAHG
jgi:hypothetical protein